MGRGGRGEPSKFILKKMPATADNRVVEVRYEKIFLLPVSICYNSVGAIERRLKQWQHAKLSE
jgi:hypothetical protein